MKAVLPAITVEDLARRQILGLDRWDEEWEGVLHLAPAPNYEHQRILDGLIAFLVPRLKRGRGILVSGINVYNETAQREDYRIPDLTFIASGREGVIARDGTRGGGPDAVIEIRSPDDETYEKLSFYAGLGVREVIVIDRDSKEPKVYQLTDGSYLPALPDHEGWSTADTLRVRFRLLPGEPPHLAVEDVVEPSARLEI